MAKSEKEDFVPTRTVTRWQVYMDYQKLNKETCKDYFPLPFIDQMPDKLAGRDFYYFLDGYLGYNYIAIVPEDQSKITFTCPYGTFSFSIMPFRLCNAPAIFQRCMMIIFTDLIEMCMDVFMDDFFVFGDTFDQCLQYLELVLERCKKINLVLNWEKYHFIVREGIVLGHLILNKGLEIDRAKFEVISHLNKNSQNLSGTRWVLQEIY